MSSQSSSLTKDSGVQSMENVSPYNRLTHHGSSEKDVPRAVHDSVTGGQWHSSPIRQQKAPSHSYTLPNGYRRDRRASFPGFSLIENQRAGAREAMAQSSPRMPQKHRAHMARRGSYDQRMLTETNQGISRDIPGMMYIPEQASDEAESLYRTRDLNKHRRNSRLQNDLPELPRYGIYGEDDDSEEIGYEPSSPSSALPRATQTGVIQHQQSPRHRRQFDTPLSSSTSSRTSTPRDYVYHTEAAGSNIMFEETDIHQYQQLRNRQRSASGSNKVLRVRDLSSEPRGGSTLQLQHSSSSSEHRKRSHSIPHLSRVRMPESAKPGILKDVWNERKQVNGSAEKISTPRTTKKNNLNKSPGAGATPVSKSAKKSNFLTGSLRNIFFGKSRKRGSQVVELDGAPSQSAVNSSTDELAASSRLKADTYHDEDGQPCSDV
ncbi:uncharacterized protein LOC110986242 isoform X2 [Acanthaster planci]|uniref:Uncharacterized protein LOC110986242 isoform X2 n=1 Tax=Acanthaster planci TaxID=133434 RepID=A0A8B7ZDB2_ACAPL|nr:uncharacterized protein LOC110986242 isoform X2 [Acanthaster planci]